MNRTFINYMAFSACVVGSALILAEGGKKSALVSTNIEQTTEEKHHPDARSVAYDKAENCTMLKVKEHIAQTNDLLRKDRERLAQAGYKELVADIDDFLSRAAPQ